MLFAATETTIYRSLDGGGSWTAANGTGTTVLPPGASLRSVVTGPGALYAGAAAGVFTSPDRGDHWYDFSEGLPNVELKELMWTQDDLFAVTHGRGVSGTAAVTPGLAATRARASGSTFPIQRG